MFDDHKFYLAGDPALLLLGRPSTLAHWRSEGRGPAYIKDSGRYKVANCTQAQPVFYGFAGLPDGKVILVSVLSLARALPTAVRI